MNEAAFPTRVVDDVDLGSELCVLAKAARDLRAPVTYDHDDTLDAGARQLPDEPHDHGLAAHFDERLRCARPVQAGSSSCGGNQS
jgi:hypothetical protein